MIRVDKVLVVVGCLCGAVSAGEWQTEGRSAWKGRPAIFGSAFATRGKRTTKSKAHSLQVQLFPWQIGDENLRQRRYDYSQEEMAQLVSKNGLGSEDYNITFSFRLKDAETGFGIENIGSCSVTFWTFGGSNSTISGRDYQPSDVKNFRVDDLGIGGTVSFVDARRFQIPGRPGQSAMINVRVHARVIQSIVDSKDKYKKINNPGLAEIQIKPSPGVKVVKLEKGAARLSGKYRPKLKTVREDLSGAFFTQLPWKATHSHSIRVVKSGYLYVLRADDDVLKKYKHVEWQVQGDAVTGPYVRDVYRTLVHEGQFLSLRGVELHLVAGAVVVK